MARSQSSGPRTETPRYRIWPGRWETLLDQILTEYETVATSDDRTKKDYLIRGVPNHVFRWSLTIIVAVALLIRIFYFDRRYFLITTYCWDNLFALIKEYCLSNTASVHTASDGISLPSKKRLPDGTYVPNDILISALFSDELSPKEFKSLVLRILEFKFWYRTTKRVLLALALSWYTLLRSSNGPWCFYLCVSFRLSTFAIAMSQKSGQVTLVDGRWWLKEELVDGRWWQKEKDV